MASWLQLQWLSLEKDMQERGDRIKSLEEKELRMNKKEDHLKHARYLRGEIDGFISNYIVEGKMAEVLKKATNVYLTPFTGGRYTVHKISSTMRRQKGMESHGLEITLMDTKDNIVKTKDQLSGGDETALGLALRIAISKLMSRIRPFKDAERRPPLINTVIMDEPLASLDPTRRHTLISMLTQDTSFNILVTHTEAEFGDCHSLIVNEDEQGRRQIKYIPIGI